MSEMTFRVTSADGTSIAYDRQGTGPAVILVGGVLDDGGENAPLAALLAEHFTVYNYARRGRAPSGDTPPYAAEREVEDLDALIAVAGGSAHLYGASSGGAVALEAAAAGSAIDKIVTWDLPYAIGDDVRPRIERFLADAQASYDAGQDEEVLELFMRMTGAPDAAIAAGKGTPFWAYSVGLASTLVHDPLFQSRYLLPTDRLGTITQPVLLLTEGTITHPVMAGLPSDYFDRAADAAAEALPHAERRSLHGQEHVVDPDVMAPLLRTFFSQ